MLPKYKRKFWALLLISQLFLIGNASALTLAAVEIITTSLPTDVVAGSPYYGTVDAIGGPDLYNWKVTKGALPHGLKIYGAICFTSPCQGPASISGTPTNIGTFNFDLTVTSGALSATRSYAINVISGADSAQTNSGGAAPLGQLPSSDTQKQEKIAEIQKLLIQLIQQLIQLLNQYQVK